MKEIKEIDFKVLLVYPNLNMMKIPSLAIALFTSILKSKGYIVELFDASNYKTIDKKGHDDRRTGSFQYRKLDKSLTNWEVKTDLDGDFIKKVKEFNPDIIIMSVVEDTFLQGVHLLNLIKSFKIPNIVGGVFPTMAPEETITPESVKMVGIGEGENTILYVCENIRKGLSCENLPNVWFKKNDGLIIKNKNDKLVDINKTIPDYSLFHKDQFYRPWGGKIFRTITLEGVRGCPYECTFCNSPAHNRIAKQMGCGTFVRRKEIESLNKELSTLSRDIDPEFIMFVDDTFLTRSMKEFDKWCEMYSNYKTPFWINTRVESITKDKLEALKQAGCYRISFSIEQGNEIYRKKYLKKYFTNKQVIEHGELIAECGIPFSMDNIIGLPFETREMVFETIELTRQIQNYDALTVNIFTPYRGTELRQLALKQGWLDQNAFPNGISGASMLKMPPPYLQRDEIEGLFRTFALYTFFPKNRWTEIKLAGSFTEEGNAMFDQLGAEYYEKKFGGQGTTFFNKEYERGTGCRAADNDSL